LPIAQIAPADQSLALPAAGSSVLAGDPFEGSL